MPIRPIALESSGGRALFGRGVEDKEYSEQFGAAIDTEVQKIMHDSFDRAQKLLTENRPALAAVAARLMEVETIEREEYELLLAAFGIIAKKKKEDK